MGTRRIRTGRAWAAALAVALAWCGAEPASAQTAAPVAAQHDAATRMSPTRTSPAGLSYGPVLTQRNGSNAQNGQAARKDPAEVRDETDTLTREAAPAAAGRQPQAAGAPASAPGGTQPSASSAQGAQPSSLQLTDKQRDEQRRRAARRRPAYQGERPMAPRPLRSGESPPAFVAEPVPAPLPAPQPVVPSSNAVRACQGIACTDAAGNTFNGSGNAGVGSGGRMCARTGATVQCF